MRIDRKSDSFPSAGSGHALLTFFLIEKKVKNRSETPAEQAKAMAENMNAIENEQKRKLEELWQKMTKAFAGYGSSSPTKDEIELLEWATRRDEMHVRVAPVMTAEPMYLGQQVGLGNGENQTQMTNNVDGFSQALDRNARVLRVIDTHITNANGKVEVIRADMFSDNNEFDVRYIDTDRNIRYVRFRDEERVGEVIVDVAERYHRNLATPTRDIRSGGGLETRLLNFSEYLNGRTVVVMEGYRTVEDIDALQTAQGNNSAVSRITQHHYGYAADIMVLDEDGEFMNRMDVAREAYYSREFNRVIYYGNNAQDRYIHVDLNRQGWQGVRQYGQNTVPSWVNE